ncbi:MAG TPA: AMP-binding protein [Kofleriaceae bacterium]|nr:AMP-binding protein [Kofleriaceae bacterium]
MAYRPTCTVTPSFAPAFALETPTLHGRATLDWLTISQRSPAQFLVALEARAKELGVAPSKTTPVVGADLYHDLIARHLGRGWCALRCYTRAPLSGVGDWQDLTFEDLHARCTHRAAWWAEQGIKAGSSICVVFPVGVEFVVSLFAALRLGAVVSWIDPHGLDFVAARLADLGPDHLAIGAFLARQLGGLAELAIPPDAVVPLPETYSHTYAADAPCLQVCSPLHAPGTVAAVSGPAAYAGALRDALTCLALRPGDALAAPGFHAMQHQPALLFAAWAIGATFVHVEESDVVREPGLLDIPLRTVGISPRVRDAYLATHGGQRPPWAHVVRNPDAACDWEAWRAFFEGCDLADTPISNLVIDAASAGALLGSPRRRATHALAYLQNVIPAPGRPWQLLDFTRSGQPAAADAGVYAPLDGGDKPAPIEPQYLVVARRGGEYLYGGTAEPRRCGRVFPSAAVLAVATRAPFLDGAAIAAVISGGASSEARFVLIGFTGDEPRAVAAAARERRCEALCAQIAGALGDDAVPDAVMLFALYARRAKGAIDLAWAQAHYLGGGLFRKANAPVFRRLTALRRSIRAAAAPDDPSVSDPTSTKELAWQSQSRPAQP